jgi:hypothetical protein
MRYSKLLLGVLPMLVLAACDDEGVTGPQSAEGTAVIRFVNVVTDTGTVDFRFQDRVENLPTLLGVTFRSHSGMYQMAAAGTRPARVFPNSTDPVLTQIMLVDTTLNLSANGRYTLVYAGRANGNQDRIAVLEDPATILTPAAGSIAIKALHAAVGTGAVDVYVVPVATTTAVTPVDFQTNNAAVISNVGYLSQTAYVQLPARPTSGLPFYRFVVTAAGSATPLFAATPNLPGSMPPAGASYGPAPGVQIAGSVLTLVVAPGSDPGTRQSTTANQTPTAFLMIDKALNP